MSILRWSILPYLLTAVLAASAATAYGQEIPPAVIRVDAVRTEPLSRTVPVIGRLVALQSGVIAAQVGGPVLEVMVNVGDRVAAGDILVMLDTEELALDRELKASQVEAATAAVDGAISGVKIAQHGVNRLEKLKKSKSAAFPKARYDDALEVVVGAQRLVARSRAILRQTQSQLRISEMKLKRAIIRAPYPGVVVLRHMAEGAWLSVGDPVIDLLNDTDLEIEADVPADRIGGLSPGTPIEVTLDDDTGHTAVVRVVIADENPMTRTRPVRFTPEFGAVNRPLAVNQSVTVHLPIGRPRQIVSVHKDAVVSKQGKALVFVVEGEAANIRPIQLGEAVGGRFEVLQGLKPGDLVVVRGNERLRPGQKVRIERDS